MTSADAQIPNRSLFRQPEVCEIAQVQPYVLRSWEAEFPDLGVSKAQGGPRVYRKADLERVLRIKHLLFVEGLTLAGARRKLQDEQGVSPAPESAAALDDLLASDARERILSIKKMLRELAAMLAGKPLADKPGNGEFQLASPVARAAPKSASKPVKTPAAPAKAAARRKVR
jgi:DNA-binding transcriptional MerR regulator